MDNPDTWRFTDWFIEIRRHGLQQGDGSGDQAQEALLQHVPDIDHAVVYRLAGETIGLVRESTGGGEHTEGLGPRDYLPICSRNWRGDE